MKIICGFLIWMVLLCVGLCGCINSQADSPKWRKPNEADYILDWKDFRKPGYTPFHFAADFNGDSIDDEAWILISDDATEWAVFVYLFNQDGGYVPYMLDKARTQEQPMQGYGISPVSPGRYKTACGKGYGCEGEKTEYVTIKYRAIDYFRYESANSIFYWDETKKEFKRVWMSD